MVHEGATGGKLKGTSYLYSQVRILSATIYQADKSLLYLQKKRNVSIEQTIRKKKSLQRCCYSLGVLALCTEMGDEKALGLFCYFHYYYFVVSLPIFLQTILY